jgi:hypothetical protein
LSGHGVMGTGWSCGPAATVSGCRDRLGAVGWRVPSSTALTKLRRRLGSAPFELLFRRLSGVWPCRTAPWSHAFGLLVVAWESAGPHGRADRVR